MKTREKMALPKISIVADMITLLTIILFLYAASSKVMDYTLFKEQLLESPILKPVSTAIAIGLPLVEFMLVVLLIIPRFRNIGLYSAFYLLIIFTLYIIIVMITSSKLPCSCGGLLEQLSWTGHIIFNVSFILAIWLSTRVIKVLKKENNKMHIPLVA